MKIPHALFRRGFTRCIAFSLVALGFSHAASAVPVGETAAPNDYDLKQAAARKSFDAIISLEDDPQSQSERGAYEDIIGYWADAVCEMTNGAHRIGRVRVHPKGKENDRADIIWRNEGQVYGHPGGRTYPTWHVRFANTYRYGCNTGQCSEDLFSDPRRGGYVLAHEWAHYFYSIYDEYDPAGRRVEATPGHGTAIYFPRNGDDHTSPSIMSSVRQALSGNQQINYDHLNASTLYLYHDFLNKNQLTRRFINNGQGRFYAVDAWSVLKRHPKNDIPRPQITNLPARIYYPELKRFAPTGSDRSPNASPWVRVVLNRPNDCRSVLDVQWITEQRQLLIGIDRSGSMAGDKLVRAQQAARTLVDFVIGGQASVGLFSFGGSVRLDVAPTPIPVTDDGSRQSLRDAISRLRAGGNTPLYDAALEALVTLQGQADQVGAVFLLSDGADSSSSATEQDVIAAYQRAGVPLYTFGYGDQAPQQTLRRMARATRGVFASAPANNAIQSAFLSALTAVGNNVAVSRFSGVVASGSRVGATKVAAGGFSIDATLASFNVLASYEGGLGDLGLTLTSPNGSSIPLDCEVVLTTTSCQALISEDSLETGGRGRWVLEAVNVSGRSILLEGSVFAAPHDAPTYSLAVGNLTGDVVSYPDPFILTASLDRGENLTAIHVEARITEPDGNVRVVALRDDGQEADETAEDGIYSAIAGYDADGRYLVDVVADNRDATARFVEEAAVADPPPMESFTRNTRLQIDVTGTLADDHGDLLPGTPIQVDNQRHAGRLETSGDVDVFAIHNASPDFPVAVRVSHLGLGMMPVLTLLGADGTELRTGDLQTGPSGAGYLYLTLAPEEWVGDVVYAQVRHEDPAAAGGLYRISAGRELDAEIPEVAVCLPDEKTLCLGEGRDTYAVTLSAPDGMGGATPTLLTHDAGSFSFDPDGGQVDALVKVLDGWSINGHRWVFVASLGRRAFKVSVTESRTGNVTEYSHSGGGLASIADVAAFRGGATQAASVSKTLVAVEAPHDIRQIPTSRQTCVATASVLCLRGGRFKAEVDWVDPQDKNGRGRSFPLGVDTGAFWFFDPDNLELLIRISEPQADQFDVEISALSNVAYMVTITDTVTGAAKEYSNPAGTFGTFSDEGAFTRP